MLPRIFHWAIVALPSTMAAQDCSIPFTQPLFDVQAEHDIWYGNATRFDGTTDSLRLNLFKPVGDGQTERPLVIVIHGGDNRNELNDYCNTLASMGWAAATISYRLGFYGTDVLDPPYAYDPDEIHRAIYRAMQDAKGAIRFLKERHVQDSTSTINVLPIGFSTGATTALHAAYLDQPGEKPAAANTIGQVQHFLDFYPRPDLGDVDGDLNQNGYDASVLGVVNIFGALLDTTFIESANDPALYSYHQTGDPFVGCDHQQPFWSLGPGIPDNYPYLHGSCSIDQRMQNLDPAPGRYLFNLHNGNEHDIHDPVAIYLQSVQWMRDLFCGITTTVEDATDATSITVRPNPSDGLFSLEIAMHHGPAMIDVHDATGKLVHRQRAESGNVVLNLSHLPRGLHLLTVTSSGHVHHQRVVLE